MLNNGKKTAETAMLINNNPICFGCRPAKSEGDNLYMTIAIKTGINTGWNIKDTVCANHRSAAGWSGAGRVALFISGDSFIDKKVNVNYTLFCFYF